MMRVARHHARFGNPPSKRRELITKFTIIITTSANEQLRTLEMRLGRPTE